MKRFFTSLVVLTLSFALVSCAQLVTDRRTAELRVRQAIEKANAKFVEAFSRGDAAAIAALYIEDAKLLPPNNPMVSGRQSIEEFWKGFIEMSVWREVILETVEVDYNGDLASEVGTYTLAFQPEGSQVIRDTGKYVVVWNRQTDGSWKLAVDTWNSNSPLPGQ